MGACIMRVPSMAGWDMDIPDDYVEPVIEPSYDPDYHFEPPVVED